MSVPSISVSHSESLNSGGIPDYSTPDSSKPIENSPNSDPSGPAPVPQDNFFARPPSNFDAKRAKGDFIKGHGQGLLNPADAVDDSVEDEIARKITELEKARGSPVTDKEKERLSNRIRSLREGGWLESLKFQLVGKNVVPIQYFNRLVVEHEAIILKVSGINARAESKVAREHAEVVSLKEQLVSAKESLEAACQTISERDAEVQLLRQHEADSLGREKNLTDQIIQLRKENEDLDNALHQSKASGQYSDPTNEILRRRIGELETELEPSKRSAKLLELENIYLKRASQTHHSDPNSLQKQIGALQADISSRDGAIKTLQSQLRDSPPTEQDRTVNEELPTELQARCAELRAARDEYKSLWAGKVVANDATLVKFWEAVEATTQEIKQLYRGIDRLGRVLGITTQVLDTPSVLDKIIARVVLPGDDENLTPQLSLLHLRNTNAIAQIQIEELKRELGKAQLVKSDDEIRAQLRIVDEDELEKRVTMRTQTYRKQRQAILSHIFDAQAKFLALADRSADKAAIEALVDQFLHPTTLAGVRSGEGGA
ncbi:hypothetical protein F5Y07DRAFT_407586 [Xylaria sp. FL0933]|nr:hypothetical protein F5Y07DRAFT_407586 [Xylaria sp. FL0933]